MQSCDHANKKSGFEKSRQINGTVSVDSILFYIKKLSVLKNIIPCQVFVTIWVHNDLNRAISYCTTDSIQDKNKITNFKFLYKDRSGYFSTYSEYLCDSLSPQV